MKRFWRRPLRLLVAVSVFTVAVFLVSQLSLATTSVYALRETICASEPSSDSCGFDMFELRSGSSNCAERHIAIVIAAVDLDNPGVASRWASANVDSTTVIISGLDPSSSSLAAKNATWSADAAVIAAREFGSDASCTEQIEDFPGMRALLPGLAAALDRGATTIAIVPGRSNASSLRAPGVVFSTDAPSLLPVVQLESNVLDTTERIGSAVPDIHCDTPSVADARAKNPKTPMSGRMGWLCSMPPREGEGVWKDPLARGRTKPWSRDTADVVGQHFLTVRRVSQNSKPLTLCSVPIVAAIQYGLCQSSHGASDGSASWLSSPLDDQATPLVLPLGEAPPAVLTAPGLDAIAVTYGGMAVHSSLAWALLPAVEPGLGQGVIALIQAVLALYGHAAVILPPGRLCGYADDIRRGGGHTRMQHLDRHIAENVVQHLVATHAWSTVDKVLLAAVHSSYAVNALSLSPRDSAALTQWLRSLRQARFLFPVVPPSEVAFVDAAAEYIVSQRAVLHGLSPSAARAIPRLSGSGLMAAIREVSVARARNISCSVPILSQLFTRTLAHGSGNEEACSTSAEQSSRRRLAIDLPQVPPLPVLVDAVPYLRHCFNDGAHMRDIVLAVTFNNYNNFSPATTALLFALYAQAYPVIVSAGEASTTLAWNHIECRTQHPSGFNYDGFNAHHCPAVVLESTPGHLGALITNDDSIIQPWNLIAEPTERVWVFRRPPELRLRPPGTQFGCWSEDNRFGEAKAAEASLHYRPRDIARQAHNGGTPTGATCQLIDTIFVPGTLATDLARLLQLHVQSGTMVEIAIATSLAAVAPISDQHVLQTAYLWGNARPTPEAIWHTAWDAVHPIKLSQPRLQYLLWDKFQQAATDGLLRLPPPAASTIFGPDGKTPKPSGEQKRSHDYSEPPS